MPSNTLFTVPLFIPFVSFSYSQKIAYLFVQNSGLCVRNSKDSVFRGKN